MALNEPGTLVYTIFPKLELHGYQYLPHPYTEFFVKISENRNVAPSPFVTSL